MLNLQRAAGSVPGARQAFIGELPEILKKLDRGHRYTVMCGSGSRATIAASLLLRSGFEQVDLYLGSFSAWENSKLNENEHSAEE